MRKRISIVVLAAFVAACAAQVCALGGRADAAAAPPASAEPEAGRPFLMAIEDVFSISGRGPVVTGRIEAGTVNVGDEIEIVGLRDTRRARVSGIEQFRRIVTSGREGDDVGILLRGVAHDQVERGQVLARLGSISACSVFEASISGSPGTIGRRVQFFFRTTDVTGTISGNDIGRARVELIAPVAMSRGQQFSIRRAGRTIASGTVLRCR